MTTFSIVTAADNSCALCAALQPEQVHAFLAMLRTEAQRLAVRLIDFDYDFDDMPWLGFEARVCPLPLASLARIFDYDLAVIAVIDDAQFRARKITIWQPTPDGPIQICPSTTSDTDAEIYLPERHAYPLLACLGIDARTGGDRSPGDIHRRLCDPATASRLAAENFTHYVPRIERLLATAAHDDTSRVLWC